MPRTRIIVAALAALALAAPAASADPHAIDAHARAEQQAAMQAELKARGRDGVQTGSLAGTTEETARSLATEQAYSTYGTPAPIEPATPAPAADDSDPWPLIGGGVLAAALMIGTAVALVARPRRSRVAT